MIVAQSEEPRLRVIYCPACKKLWAIVGQTQTSCCVMHGAGSCCHRGWTPISEQSLDEARRAMFSRVL